MVANDRQYNADTKNPIAFPMEYYGQTLTDDRSKQPSHADQ
jgi:hypothetical protein